MRNHIVAAVAVVSFTVGYCSSPHDMRAQSAQRGPVRFDTLVRNGFFFGFAGYFYAEDKLTFAATEEKSWVVAGTIEELEARLDGRKFVRVHRSAIVNLDYADELLPWFGGKMILRLKDGKRTEVSVARERLKELKERLGL